MPLKRLELYKCEICGNIVEVLNAGGPPLVCCGENMKLQGENTVDAAKEKHVPVIEMGNGQITVRIGSVPHPMEEKHYIQWVELIADGKAYLQFLKPGEEPKAVFPITANKVTAREYCNLHGHWKAES
jgi:superoxide reductase